MSDLSKNEYLKKLMPALSNLYRAMATSRDTFLAQFNLSRPQLELLIFLKKKPCSTRTIAKEFAVSSSSVTQMIDQLIQKNLVTRKVDLNDKRVQLITLSENGAILFEEIQAKYFERLETKFEMVSSDEIKILLNEITKISQNIAKEYK